MKISMQLNYALGYKQAAQQVIDLEKAGLDMVWVAEAYGFDGVSLMGYLAAETTDVTIASGILPIYTRTPTLLAQTAAIPKRAVHQPRALPTNRGWPTKKLENATD